MKENEMDAREVFEFLKHQWWKLGGYYKYTFTYVAENDKYKMSIFLGGNADDIYKMHLSPERTFADWNFDDVPSWRLINKETQEAMWGRGESGEEE